MTTSSCLASYFLSFPRDTRGTFCTLCGADLVQFSACQSLPPNLRRLRKGIKNRAPVDILPRNRFSSSVLFQPYLFFKEPLIVFKNCWYSTSVLSIHLRLFSPFILLIYVFSSFYSLSHRLSSLFSLLLLLSSHRNKLINLIKLRTYSSNGSLDSQGR